MKKQEIIDRVKNVTAHMLGFNASDINEEDSFVDKLGADSLDQIEMVMAIEEEFEIEIDDETAEKFETVSDVVKYITVRLNGADEIPDVVRFQLVVDVEYDPNGVDPDVLQHNLTHMVDTAVGNGALTGETAATVENWHYNVSRVVINDATLAAAKVEVAAEEHF
jgi:acyl carrier protein